jgi:hypothetical protein
MVSPYANAAGTPISITDFLGQALLYTVVVAVLAVIVYFVYERILKRTP